MAAIPWLGFLLLTGLVVAHVVSKAARAWTWKIAGGAGALWLGTGAWVGLVWAPADQYMGDVQRILYVHVPVLWTGLLALTLNFVASLVSLFTGRRFPDALAEATAEVGVVFGFIGLAIGAVWGKPTWGVWWSWDPRMIATAAMLGLYCAYLLVRRFTADPDARAFRSGTVACLVSVVLPVVWYSVRWFASLHQQQSTRASMDPRMLLALGWVFAGFLLLFFALVWQRTLLALEPERRQEPREATHAA